MKDPCLLPVFPSIVSFQQVVVREQHKIRAKRRRGEGIFGKLFCREMKSNSELPAVVRQTLRNARDERLAFLELTKTYCVMKGIGVYGT